jgi:hypothetical protein
LSGCQRKARDQEKKRINERLHAVMSEVQSVAFPVNIGTAKIQTVEGL